MPVEDLVAMAVFAHVVQAGSFSAAAGELGMSKSAVSRAVSGLEDRLGVRLLNRTTRRIGLTEAGTALHERAVRMLAEAEAAEIAVARLADAPRGVLRISGPTLFGEHSLVPLLGELLERHPGLRVELSLSDRFVDLVEEGFDVAVRIAARLQDSSLVGRRLREDPRLVVASPEYLARRGVPAHPRDLTGHDCLLYSLVPVAVEWRFVEAGEIFSVDVTGPFTSNHGGAIRAAALDGLGLAISPISLVADDLRDGRLVAVLDDFRVPGHGAIWAVYPHSRHLSPKVRAFVDFLAEKLRS